MSPRKKYANRKSPRPTLLRTSRCGREFHGAPKDTKKARDEHEAKCAACHREKDADDRPENEEE